MKNLFEKYGKKKVYFTALGIAVALSLVVVAISMSLGNNTVKLAVENQVVEYGENPYDVKLEKVIKDYDKLVKNKKLKDVQLSLVQDKKEIKKSDITKEKLLPVGKYVLNITSGEEVKLALDVEVKDTVAPKFVDFKKDIKIEQNAKDVKLESYFKAEDLSETEITTKGEVKLETIGKYEISVTATDKYKNATTNKATIEVVSMETAESEGVSETAEGTKPISSELATKQEEAANAWNTVDNSNTGVTVPNNGGGATDNGNTGGGSAPVETPAPEPAPAPQPNGIGAVIATAQSFVGRGDMSCNDLVVQAYKQNNYDTPYDNARSMGYSVGTDSSVLQAGDWLRIPNHVILVISVSGSEITAIEGGRDGTNVLITHHVVQGATIWMDGVGQNAILEIRRM